MKSILVALCALGMLAAGAQANTLAGWDFSTITASGGNWGDSPMTPQTLDANVTVVGLTRNWALLGTGTAAAYAWGGNNFAIAPNNTQAGAIAASNFASFSLTANPGYTLSISDIPAYNIRHSASGPVTGLWQYSVGAGSFTDIGTSITWGSNTTSAGNVQSAITLSGISDLQNVPAGTTVTFRCVTWGATTTGGTWYFNEATTHTTAPEIAVNGTLTAMPEPATLALLALGGLFLRRRMA
jgi:hypothetical protein